MSNINYQLSIVNCHGSRPKPHKHFDNDFSEEVALAKQLAQVLLQGGFGRRAIRYNTLFSPLGFVVVWCVWLGENKVFSLLSLLRGGRSPVIF